MLDQDSVSPSTPLERRAAAPAWLEGWTLTLLVGAAIASLSFAIVIAGGASAEAIGRAIRLTARTSLALFLAAFTASAACRLWPGRFTRWQLRNRRYLGVAFAASHAAHAAAIVALALLQPAAFQAQTGGSVPVPGLIAYGFLAAMTATSFDRTTAWLGRRAWKALHLVGSIYLWGAFFTTFLGRALETPAYWAAVALVVAAMVVRVTAWYRGRRRRTRTPRRGP